MTAASPWILHGFWRTSATYRVRVALRLKGIAVQERIVDLDAGQQRSGAYLALNPLGGIPTLEVPGYPPLTQSLAILEFLEDLQPAPPLLPADPHGRARVRALAGMLATDTHPLITPRVRRFLAPATGLDDAGWRAWQTHWFQTGLQAVESRLAGDAATGLFCHGDTPGMADICLSSILAVMQVLRIQVDAIPTVDRIVSRCQALEAFQAAEPRRQPGAPG